MTLAASATRKAKLTWSSASARSASAASPAAIAVDDRRRRGLTNATRQSDAVPGAERERPPRDARDQLVLARADRLPDQHRRGLGERVRGQERDVHEVQDELVRRAVDGAHAGDEHGQDQERADLHDELQAVRHALRPDVAHRLRPPPQACARRARIGHASTRSSVTLPQIVASAAPRTPQPRPRMSTTSSAMLTALPASAARIGARRVALAVAALAERRVQQDQRRAERADREGTARRTRRRAATRRAARGAARSAGRR